MPHIEPELANSVVYLFGPDPDKKGKKKLGGTGFIVSRSSATLEGFEHYYAVTNAHVFADSPQIRLNTLDGRTDEIKADQIDWRVRRGFDDMAILDITDRLDLSKHEISSVPESAFLGENQSYFGIGDEVVMIGLFANEPGVDRNFPKARFGNISGVADRLELIKQPNGVRRPTHIIDMRSRTGYSGSPVFVYEAPHHLWTDNRWTLRWSESPLLKLLGVHCGQYPDTIRAAEIRRGARTGVESEWEIPASMNIAVPAWRISELLDDGVLEQARVSRDEGRRDAHRRQACPEDE